MEPSPYRKSFVPIWETSSELLGESVFSLLRAALSTRRPASDDPRMMLTLQPVRFLVRVMRKTEYSETREWARRVTHPIVCESIILGGSRSVRKLQNYFLFVDNSEGRFCMGHRGGSTGSFVGQYGEPGTDCLGGRLLGLVLATVR